VGRVPAIVLSFIELLKQKIFPRDGVENQGGTYNEVTLVKAPHSDGTPPVNMFEFRALKGDQDNLRKKIGNVARKKGAYRYSNDRKDPHSEGRLPENRLNSKILQEKGDKKTFFSSGGNSEQVAYSAVSELNADHSAGRFPDNWFEPTKLH